jgi:hypothetical protein
MRCQSCQYSVPALRCLLISRSSRQGVFALVAMSGNYPGMVGDLWDKFGAQSLGTKTSALIDQNGVFEMASSPTWLK